MAKNSIIVIGHKNPDTDSVVSAVIYRDYLEQKGLKAKACRAGDLNKETKFVFSQLGERAPQPIENLEGQDVVLVDHSEIKQAVHGVEKANILQVIDHHRMAGLSTFEPILYRCEPVGSTSTVVCKIFKEAKMDLNKKQAALLLAGIISDTLNFTSPTTTQEDKKIAGDLEKISGLDVEKFSAKMFEAKSNLKGISINDILTKDYKEFDFSGINVGIGVYETAVMSPFEKMKEKIFHGLSNFKKDRGVTLLLFAAVDILKQEAFMYLIGEKERELVQRAFKGELKEENVMHLPGIVSRKKQMVPVLAKVLEK